MWLYLLSVCQKLDFLLTNIFFLRHCPTDDNGCDANSSYIHEEQLSVLCYVHLEETLQIIKERKKDTHHFQLLSYFLEYFLKCSKIPNMEM